MYLPHVHNFRAIAITLIVAGHCIPAFNWQQSPLLEGALLDIFANGTVLFVFIAGYLFHHLSKKYEYKDYLKKKMKNVVLPYFIISIPAVWLAVFWEDPEALYPQLTGSSTFYQIIWFYVKGGAHINFPLWFIPMIFLFYIAAPIFMEFKKSPKLYWLLPVFFIPVSLLAHRPEFPNLDVIHSCIYYLSAYLLGMFASQFRQDVDDFVDQNFKILLGIYLIIFVFHLTLSNTHGNYSASTPFALEAGFIDWTYFQKLLMCFLLLGFLRKFDVSSKVVGYTATVSFTIFFVHAYFIVFFQYYAGIDMKSIHGGIFNFSLFFILVTLLSLGVSYFGQKIFKHRSRYIIGC